MLRIKSLSDNKVRQARGKMPQEPKCEYRTSRKGLTSLCGLGFYGGKVTDGTCRRCVKENQNNVAYQQELKAIYEKSKTVGNTVERKYCCGSKITPFST
jgi:hypothetical protein